MELVEGEPEQLGDGWYVEVQEAEGDYPFMAIARRAGSRAIFAHGTTREAAIQNVDVKVTDYESRQRLGS